MCRSLQSVVWPYRVELQGTAGAIAHSLENHKNGLVTGPRRGAQRTPAVSLVRYVSCAVRPVREALQPSLRATCDLCIHLRLTRALLRLSEGRLRKVAAGGRVSLVDSELSRRADA